MDDINPFEIFNIEPKFNIENLDNIYFRLYKIHQQLEKELNILNVAYNLLKDKLTRAKILCELNGQNQADNNLPKEIFNLISLTIDEKKLLLNESKEEVFKNALENNWPKTWYWVQKYSYLKRMVEQ